MRSTVTVTVATGLSDGRRLLAPLGIPTPHQMPAGFSVRGAPFLIKGETTTEQVAALVTPEPGQPVTFVYEFTDGGIGYPETLFAERCNRYTQAAAELVDESERVAAAETDGHAAIAAIVNDVATRFVYGHPDVRFNEGTEEVPYVSCGMGEGSCVDINTYLIASLRAAGYEAGYVTGYFFPEEKGNWCEDMHCWVVTRQDGVIAEWDIAHHLKMGMSEIRSGLNPKPGRRVAVAHSMGLDFPDLNIRDMKLLAEPVWIDASGKVEQADLEIQLAADDLGASEDPIAQVS